MFSRLSMFIAVLEAISKAATIACEIYKLIYLLMCPPLISLQALNLGISKYMANNARTKFS
jgi:hypothetical protein